MLMSTAARWVWVGLGVLQSLKGCNCKRLLIDADMSNYETFSQCNWAILSWLFRYIRVGDFFK